MRYFILILLLFLFSCRDKEQKTSAHPAIVFQSDFGVKDGAVSAMKGVAHFIAPESPLYDLTHEIPAYNIWEAAYRLNQTVTYWPPGTIFVSVVDPGVGTDRKPVVMELSTGQYIVTQDNGTLTLVAESIEVRSTRVIDAKYRWPGSESSNTFHGRDVFSYVAASLASGSIKFKDLGPELKEIVKIPHQRAAMENDSTIKGNIPVLDIQYGNVWTNIQSFMMRGINYGDSLSVTISKKSQPVFTGVIPFVRTFGEVPEGKLLGYMNSLGNFSVAINMGSFADSFKIASGPEWSLRLQKMK